MRWDILDAFREAAAQFGIPKIEDFNRGDNLGCGYFQVNQKRGRRWNATKAFLRPALRRRNLKVVTGAARKPLSSADGRAVGVAIPRPRGREVFVGPRRHHPCRRRLGSP